LTLLTTLWSGVDTVTVRLASRWQPVSHSGTIRSSRRDGAFGGAGANDGKGRSVLVGDVLGHLGVSAAGTQMRRYWRPARSTINDGNASLWTGMRSLRYGLHSAATAGSLAICV
jgi:hypothetical protein